MEGSVKNLLEAEQEAKLIVEEATALRTQQLQEANVKAAQEVNAKREQWEKRIKDDAEKVSWRRCTKLECLYRMFTLPKSNVVGTRERGFRPAVV